VPDNKLYVIDPTTSPPSRIATVEVGKQPSGLSINKAGNLALIANRADNSISVLSIQGKEVKLIDTVPMGEQIAHVVFTPRREARARRQVPRPQDRRAERGWPEGKRDQAG
jgi:YVTN family beta-propeller protein